MSDIRIGELYQFNKARARILEVTDKQIFWREDHLKMVRRQTERWFFEKYCKLLELKP